MATLSHRVALVGGLVLGFGAFIAAFVAYFITRVGPTGEFLDGFGRPLSESPILMRLLLGQERLWAGWSWFAVDMVVFWGSLSAARFLVNFASKERK